MKKLNEKKESYKERKIRGIKIISLFFMYNHSMKPKFKFKGKNKMAETPNNETKPAVENNQPPANNTAPPQTVEQKPEDNLELAEIKKQVADLTEVVKLVIANKEQTPPPSGEIKETPPNRENEITKNLDDNISDLRMGQA